MPNNKIMKFCWTYMNVDYEQNIFPYVTAAQRNGI